MMNIPAVLVDAATCLGTIASTCSLPPLTAEDIRRALTHPIWPGNEARTVFDIVKPGESVCLVVSDHTRKAATDLVLPVLLAGLLEKGCVLDDMYIIVASGIHRPPTQKELVAILGPPAARQFEGRVFFHDPDDDDNLVDVGVTRRGCRVRVNRRAVEAERLVLVGSATYHYHAGFGGGRKSLVPGLAARDTIAHSHSLTLDPNEDRINPAAKIGVLEGNPVAEEMLEGAVLCRPDVIINTVLAPGGELVGVFSGELNAAHRVACGLVERVCRVDIAEPADFVVALAGTASNWIQGHKALFNAHRAIRRRGRAILLTPCPEGLGDERFRYWIRKGDIESICKGLRQSSEVLGQTALSTRMLGTRTVLVTSMPRTDINDLGITTMPDAESAIRMVLEELIRDSQGRLATRKPSYYLMPEATHTVPFGVAP